MDVRIRSILAVSTLVVLCAAVPSGLAQAQSCAYPDVYYGYSEFFGEPVSVARLALTEAGRSDPLLAGVTAPFDAFVGHKEAEIGRASCRERV